MKLYFAAMLCAMLLVCMSGSNTSKVSGFCIVQSGNVLWPENYGVKSATQPGRFQPGLIVDLLQPISFAAGFRHDALAPKVPLIISARDGENKAVLSSSAATESIYFPKTATVQ